MPQSDDELVLDVSRGNILAFTELFNRHKSEVVNFVYRQCGDYAKAEDIAQECFLKVYHNASSYQGKGKLKNWLLTIALNITRSMLVRMSERNKPVALDPQIVDKGEGPSTRFQRSEMETTIQEALNQLPAEQKEVISLRHFHDLKFGEIAIILNCPVETVKSRMRYGLLKLLELLKGTGYEM